MNIYDVKVTTDGMSIENVVACVKLLRVLTGLKLKPAHSIIQCDAAWWDVGPERTIHLGYGKCPLSNYVFEVSENRLTTFLFELARREYIDRWAPVMRILSVEPVIKQPDHLHLVCWDPSEEEV